jgi:glycosyltransferase involved in cell wall biosynthesis
MKIAVFHNLPSGGAKRALYGQVKYLHSVGHQIEVHIPSTADDSYLSLKEFASGFHVYPLRQTPAGLLSSFARYGLPPMFSIVDQEKTHQRIAEAINASASDLVFSEHDQFTGAPFLFRYLEKPAIYYCPEPLRFQEKIQEEVEKAAAGLPRLPAYKKVWHANWKARLPKIDRENARYAKCILTNSCFSRENILRTFGQNSFVSYLGIDTLMFRPLLLPKQDFVLSVGICELHKGFDFIIRALSLIDELSRPRLIIVANRASPNWEKYLVDLAERLDVDLEIKKAVSDRELVVLYNQARAFLYGSILEPFGLAPLEAMACRTPVIAVKEGGVRETVVHRETGILTERCEPEFAEAIAELLGTERLAKQWGDNALQWIRKFWTWEQGGERLTGHLNRVAGFAPQGVKV